MQGSPVAANPETSRWTLGPVRSRLPWMVSGLALQATGLGGAAAFLWVKLRHEGFTGHITAATVQLVWHSEVHTRTGLAVIIAGAVIYAVDSVLLARPYVSRPVTLFVAVPAAAIIGMVLLGFLAFLISSLHALIWDLLTPDFDFSGRRKKEKA